MGKIVIRGVVILSIMGLTTALMSEEAFAVVGMAEQYDEFKKEDLEEFHQFLLREETHRIMQETMGKSELSEDEEDGELSESEREGASLEMPDEEKQEEFRKIQLKALREQLLVLPKRDRFKVTSQFDYKYHMNVNRDDKRVTEGNGDSLFDVEAIAAFDLSGKKTDLRYDFLYGRVWNWEFSERDYYQVSNRLRYRRQYFKKVRHSNQLNFTRHNSKTVEIDSNKIRYDISHRNTFNYAFSPKTELNFDFGGQKRLFTQEAFDQDSQWQVDFAPSFFWNVTPKSRFSGAYEFGASRIRSKTGDTNSHSLSLNYFGAITRKSSLSFDIARERQIPRSKDTSKVKTLTTGIGYIYQASAKTQITTQLFRSVQSSTSNFTAGEVDGENTTSKTDQHFTNTSASVSFNSNLTRRVNANITWNVARQTNKTFIGGTKDDETYTVTYPLSVKFRFLLTRWLTLNLAYVMDFREGKKDESYKNNIFNFTVTTVF